MTDTPETAELPPSLRVLRGLVTVLTFTMIGGLLTVVYLLVTRMPDGRVRMPTLPPALALPAGEVAEAVTFGAGWSAVVTKSQRLFLFDASGKIQRSLDLTPPAP